MSSLMVISSAPAKIVHGKAYLDIKFVEGMRRYSALWDGPVSCILKNSGDTIPFGRIYRQDELPFGLVLMPGNRIASAENIRGYDVLLCSGDDYELLHLAALSRETKQKLVYVIENITETRCQIIALDRSRSFFKRMYSTLWVLKQELRRRRAFRLASGIQANGYPAFEIYRRINSSTMMYLDNRVDEKLLATDIEMEARRQRLMTNAPVRLLHSGRLEPIKGSQDLIPIARRLSSMGVDFNLDIFGTGSLEGEIREGVIRYGLEGRVKLHGVVDFETELVPFARKHADIYLSCHRQSDPSCTYIENMGCGLTVVGYSNRMWSALCEEAGAGWLAPLGDVHALADTVAQAIDDRGRLASFCSVSLRFARSHSFEREFQRRIVHLQSLD